MKQGLVLITVTVVGVKECPAIHRYCPGMGEEVKSSLGSVLPLEWSERQY